MPAPRKISWVGWMLPLLLALVASLLAHLDVAQDIERRLLDARFKIRGPRSVEHTPFQIVAVDDQSFSDLDTKWPFRGSLYARLIENLNRAGARLIVFDIEFCETNTFRPEEDSLLAAAIIQAGNVVLAGKIAYIFDPSFSQPYASIVTPLQPLVATKAPWGIINELTDSDDFTRRYLLYLAAGDQKLNSLGIEILRAMHHLPDSAQIHLTKDICQFAEINIPLYDRQSFIINYYGPAGIFPAISFSSVLDDSSFAIPNGFDSNYMQKYYPPTGSANNPSVVNPFLGKVILIGASAEELHDTKNTPFYDYFPTPRKMAGVEVHAHALQTILDGAFIYRSSPVLIFILNLLTAVLIFRLVAALKPLRGLIMSLLLVVGTVAASFIIFAWWDYWLDITPLLATSILAYPGTTLYQYFRIRRERASIQDMFAHYVPDKVVQELINNPQMLKLGGERRHLTVLFADLDGFTSITEKMEPEQLVLHLNEYMTAMTEIILQNGGIIDKYEGDLIMAEFGAPVSYNDHGVRACRAALQMQAQLAILRAQWESAGKPALTARIGINTGEMIIGNMGSREVFDYTVLGDAVNLCARLQDANKIYGTAILISQFTLTELPGAFVTRPLDDLRVRGRREAVRVYELLAEESAALSETLRKVLAAYHQGWAFYQEQKWHLAGSAFEVALSWDQHDHPSHLLLDRCRQFAEKPPQKDWDGVFASTEL